MSSPARRAAPRHAVRDRAPDDRPTVKMPAQPPRRGGRPDDPTQRMPARPRAEELPAGSAAEQAPAVELSAHERLLQSARERFAADGYENATTAAIARQAGTSESQLVKHFGSKEGLLEAIFDEAWTALEAAARAEVQEQASPVAGLLALGDAVMRALERDHQLRGLVLLEGRRIRKHGHDVALSAGFRRFLALTDDLFLAMQKQGELRPEIHLEAARSAWMGAIEGMLRDQLMSEQIGYPAGFNRKIVRRTALAVLSSFLTPRAQRLVQARSE